MKYVTPLIVLALIGGSAFAAWKIFPDQFEVCCEYIGLIAPDGVSEIPGVAHVSFSDTGGKLPADAPGLRIGESADQPALIDLHGNQAALKFGDGKITAVVWVSQYCPTSQIYEERLNELYASFPNVRWYAINSSAAEGMEELRERFESDKPDRLRIKVLKDERNVMADHFGVRVTTETFLFDGHGKLRYRGAIDDARNPQRVEHQFVRDALKQMTAGKAPPYEFQPPNGCCPIDRVVEDVLEPEIGESQ